MRDMAGIPLIEEINVGRSILARSMLVGVERAIGTMKNQLEHR